MRVVDSVTPGLGGPQVIWRRDGSQGPAFAFRGTDGYWLSLLNEARKGAGTTMTSWQSLGPREANCDQYFFPQPFGTRIGNQPGPLASARRTGGEPTHL